MIFEKQFLQRCRDITNHYESLHGTWHIDKQILKIYEELNEVNNSRNTSHMLEELCDVILATITVFDLMGIPHDRINRTMESTLQKVENKCKSHVRYNFCKKNCGRRTDTKNGICRMCREYNN